MRLASQRKYALILIDTCIYLAVYAATVLIAFQSSTIETSSPEKYLITAIILYCTVFGMRFIARVYNNVWRYANSRAYLSMLLADTIGGLIGTAIGYAAGQHIGIWHIVTALSGFALLSLASRFVYQQHYQYLNMSLATMNKINVAIVGAGHTGAMLAEDMLCNSASHYKPVCFIDVNPEKIGGKVCGIKILPGDENIVETLKGMPIQEIFIAIPDLDSQKSQALIEKYRPTGCKIKFYDFALRTGNTASKPRLRELNFEELLFRDALRITTTDTKHFYHDKVVLVTGGGGSIGSELCRQVAKQHPKKLIVFDIYENNAYDLQQELVHLYGDTLDLVVEIGSVRDTARLEDVFAKHRPQIVFHAAAHKHVPLMEHNGGEAIKNNVLGTYNTADTAEKFGAEKFILISTDKAVNPTNIMGASKRMCEMIVQCRTESKTTFAAVRLGNVLGSNGSVIPLFRRQIESGGPITITDKRIIRYFMTIPEAAQLVMQAGAMAKRGELFVLDMGKPVKILELAENMIRLSGLTPYKDIDIEEVGLRPGEKLYEELLIKTEQLTKTDNDLIFIEHDAPRSRAEIDKDIRRFTALCHGDKPVDSDGVKRLLKEIIPTYHNPEEVNRSAEQTMEMQAASCPDAAADSAAAAIGTN